MNNKDWTSFYNKKEAVEISNKIIDQLINSIYEKKISIFSSKKLKKFELGLLLRWPLYVAINTFIERYIRLLYYKKENQNFTFIEIKENFKHYTNTSRLCDDYYNDLTVNNKLISRIYKIISKSINLSKKGSKNKSTFKDFYEREKDTYSFQTKIMFFFQRKIKNYLSIFFRFFKKPIFIYDGDNWLSDVYPIISRFPELKYQDYQPNNKIREKIKESSRKIINKNFIKYLKILNQKDKKALIELFVEWIDYSIPLSVIEGLDKTINYYNKILSNWQIKQVHTCRGYYFNDNLKIFSILAKRKNCLLISHEEGVNNFISYLPKNKKLPNRYKAINQIMYSDYYIFWGKNKLSDKWDNVQKKFNTKIINRGSVYLGSLKKRKPNLININQFTLLYISGPSRNFMANLEEITTEKNLTHKKNVINYIKSLLKNYKGLKIYYKPFPGIDTSVDLIDKILPNNLKKRIQFTNKKSVHLMKEVDIVFFDMLSTGFAEALQIQVPALAYINDFEYESASIEGKLINDSLAKNKLVFFNKYEGMKAIKNLIVTNKYYSQSNLKILNKYKEAIAYPVKKNMFLNSLDSLN